MKYKSYIGSQKKFFVCQGMRIFAVEARKPFREGLKTPSHYAILKKESESQDLRGDSMDCTFKTELGKFNYRVGVIIYSGRRVLMARNPKEKRAFYYSVGGRVRFGESMEEAAVRD